MECQGVAAECGWNVLIGQGCPAVDEVSLSLRAAALAVLSAYISRENGVVG